MLSTIYNIVSKYPKLTDIHISADDYIYIRHMGNLQQVTDAKTDEKTLWLMVQEILSYGDKSEYIYDIPTNDTNIANNNEELDISRSHESLSFRANIYHKSGNMAIAIRKLNHNDINIYDIMDKWLADNVTKGLLMAEGGLILVTWATGSGKSTTIAAMINRLNTHTKQHIITLEDPIEYIFINDKSLISQRQVGMDTDSFDSGLKSILRQNPDVIMIWEIRDTQTALAAINMAESWHLVFATLHTRNASQTVSRLASFVPVDQRDEVQLRISMSLLWVLCQKLITKWDELIAIYEYMYNNPAISNLIKKWDYNQISNTILTGKNDGMITMKDYEQIIK